ncbi:D(1a) dopamine receptor [Plakobranchus ocellatus]|uniref:D(1a) dopamine receptor n=1 Tax=Plakobranchus ocellatus TaxID=259542 RepID=A0AAV4BB66_9GAST|nr:D(1a) dopamine receptor [Plakobranchus ocellatus]
MNTTFPDPFFHRDNLTYTQAEPTAGTHTFTVPDMDSEDEENLAATVKYASVFFMSMLILITFHGNVWVIAAIFIKPHLRGAVANIFTLNLCCVDLLASTVSMPLSVITFAGGSQALSGQACQTSAFIGSLAMLASTLNLSVISCERLYSIALPMHQAGHACPALYLLLVVLLWSLSALLAAMPWIKFNSYSYSSSRRMCSLTWHSDNQADRAIAITFFVISYIIPMFVLITMYSGIFRVAKKAACGVVPQQNTAITAVIRHMTRDQTSVSATDPQLRVRRVTSNGEHTLRTMPSICIWGATPSASAGDESNSPRAHQTPNAVYDDEDSGIRMDSNNSLSMRKATPGGEKFAQRQVDAHHSSSKTVLAAGPSQPEGASTVAPADAPHVHTLSTGVNTIGNTTSPTNTFLSTALSQASGVGNKVKPSHMKAFKTLLVIVLTHLILWCPYFACNLYELVYQVQLPLALNTAVTWLSCISYAVNPCLYGCLNRGIREELVRHLNMIQDMCCCFFHQVNVADNKSSLRCGCQRPCKPRLQEESDGGDMAEDSHADRGEESFFQFLQRTYTEDN